ncbi:Hypothetical protein NTJ_08323 [Nesidiocoris tenuis]|uniref:Uncharacterized protein n=1 Tax=Nesidiocoris tenuis TaxID=355587 RepID=A0ABN7AYC6_9HEMI|nr:Hypothetical protein NTJ_08323 [Nesidiocoris tenuis]
MYNSNFPGITEGKAKRDLSIVGPVPSGFRGQATGQTTFDGIAAEDLTLPLAPGQNPLEGRDGLRANRAPQPNGFRCHQIGQPSANFDCRSSDLSVANFGGQPETTVDGIVSSDLSLPPVGAQFGNFDASTSGNGDFDPETPTQRHDRLTNQYADVLTEYRNSLNKFNQELNEYTEVKAKRPRQ